MCGLHSFMRRAVAPTTSRAYNHAHPAAKGGIMSSRRVKIVAGIVLCAVFVTSGGVIIAQGNRPRTEAVTGIFTGVPVNAKQRVCEGADGAYLEVGGHFSGAIIS